ncbi:MAG: PHA/PHB synthase family protein [Roseiarcus sp.]
MNALESFEAASSMSNREAARRARRRGADVLDGLVHAAEGRASGGLSPVAQGLAVFDWSAHLMNAPFRRVELAAQAVRGWTRMVDAARGETVIEPKPDDHRFQDPAWKAPPFSFYEQAFLIIEQWWADATDGPPGVNAEDRRVVGFGVRQWIDMFSPSNIPWANPEVLNATWESGGANFLIGLDNYLADLRTASGLESGLGGFVVGNNLAITPGSVVYRNELIELIQYAPTTAEVAREPVLIMSAWIMKYYILDLRPENSLIRYLVGRGHTVFVISWRNPGAEFHGQSLDDYRVKGLMAAFDVIGDICPGQKVQATGYCLGGTLLAIGAAAMGRDDDRRLAGVTLFAAQTDFSEAGELQLFITADQLAFLDDVMRAQGFLDASQMAGAFQSLRSNDLIWSRLIKSYLIGVRDHPNDLMAWNADATRMPARMHSEYLHKLFQRNEIAEGRFLVDGKPIALNDIRAPLFVVGAEADHVAPWRSVHKLHAFNDAELTFALASGGHNAGIVSPPGHPRRHYRILRREAGGHYLGPDEWFAAAELRDGSWWPAWADWLDAHSAGRTPPPAMGSDRHPAIEPAPGKYVLQK